MYFNLQGVHKETVARLQNQIKEARKVIEDLETQSVLQIAEAKQQMHTTIEAKDSELEAARGSMVTIKQENESLRQRVEHLEKQSGYFFNLREIILLICYV
jgi:polyhydroxyalkanoate synthesis regulator phasin